MFYSHLKFICLYNNLSTTGWIDLKELIKGAKRKEEKKRTNKMPDKNA